MRVGDDRRVAVLDRVDVELGQLDRRRGSAGRARRAAGRRRSATVAWRELEARMAPDELGGERAGEPGGAGDEHPRGGLAVERSRSPVAGDQPRSSAPIASSAATIAGADARRPRRRSASGRRARNSSRSARLRLPSRDLLALVDVEDGCRAQQLAAGLDDRVAGSAAARDVAVGDDRDVLGDARDGS